MRPLAQSLFDDVKTKSKVQQILAETTGKLTVVMELRMKRGTKVCVMCGNFILFFSLETAQRFYVIMSFSLVLFLNLSSSSSLSAVSKSLKT